LYKSPLVASEVSIVMRESTRRNRAHECLSVAIEKGGKTAITRHLANIHWPFGRRWGLRNGVALNCAPWQQRKTVRNHIARVSSLSLKVLDILKLSKELILQGHFRARGCA